MAKDMFKIMEDVIFLKKNKIFSSINSEDLKAIAAVAKEIALKHGDVVVKAGDLGDSFFITEKGSIRVTAGEKEREVDLSVLPANISFGEMAIF